MSWFEQLFGFAEASRNEVHRNLRVDGSSLVSLRNGHRYGVGELSTPSLSQLRRACLEAGLVDQPKSDTSAPISVVRGDVRELHSRPEFAGAVFQVASQFNLLEMVSPEVRPEDGITRYVGDPTQGPACALAAAAGTAYRNYFVPLGGGQDLQLGQTHARQIDTSTGLRSALAHAIGVAPERLWVTRNGYALPSVEALNWIADHLGSACSEEHERLKGTLAVGAHLNVEVTDLALKHGSNPTPGQFVHQVYCSALPVAYGADRRASWEPLARLVLDAAYEATFRVAALEALKSGRKATLLLTRLGGGVFGNEAQWIDDAIHKSRSLSQDWPLEIYLVSR